MYNDLKWHANRMLSFSCYTTVIFGQKVKLTSRLWGPHRPLQGIDLRQHVLKHECWCVELKYSIYYISDLLPPQKRGWSYRQFLPYMLAYAISAPNLVNVARLLLWHEKRNPYQKLCWNESVETSATLRSADLWVSKQVQTAFDCVFAALETSASNSPGATKPEPGTLVLRRSRKRPGPN